MRTNFKTGFCAHCGAQTWVKNRLKKLLKPLDGTQAAWLCLVHPSGELTRVGSLSLCANCTSETVNLDDLLDNLIAGKGSGLNGDEYEVQTYVRKYLEFIPRAGE